jgi:hypothetical protein
MRAKAQMMMIKQLRHSTNDKTSENVGTADVTPELQWLQARKS